MSRSRTALILWSRPILLFLLIPFARGNAQQPVQGGASGKTYAVAGTVVNPLTGRPIPRVLVRLNESSRAMLTGANGDFSFDNVPAGTTQVEVTKPGYFRPGMPARHYQAYGGDLPYRVDVGSDVGKLLFKLAPEAIVFGTILGNEDEPLEGVELNLLESRVIQGRRELINIRQAASDEDGNFHIAGLVPGRYYLSAQAGRVSRSLLGARSEKASETYPVIVYFPSSSDVAGATPFDVVAGQQIEANFDLKMGPGFNVAGTVLGGADGPIAGPPVLVNDLQQPLVRISRFDPQSGAFEFQAVPAGTYWLQFWASARQGQNLPIYRRLEVQSNITGLRLAIPAGVDIPIVQRREFIHLDKYHCTYSVASNTGEVTQSDCSDYPAVQLELRSLDVPPLQFQSDAGLLKNGFSVHGVLPGRYTVRASPRFGGYVQSVRCGSADLMREPLVVSEGGDVEAIEVVVRDDAATLNIKVQSDKPNEEIRVFVFSDPTTMTEPRFEQTSLQSDVEFGAMAPGNYKIFAVDAGDDFDYSNPETLEKYASQAASVTLAADQKTNVAVNMIRTGE